MRWYIILSALFLGSFALRGAEVSPASTIPVTDPVQVNAHYREIAARPEYRDTKEIDISSRLKDTLSEWFLRIGKKFGEFKYSGEMPAFASLLMTVLVIISITGLLYVMIRLTRRRAGMDLAVSVSAVGPKTFRPPEFYDDEIQQAVADGNWHGAWLASWRQFLSRLENRHLVEADRTRTNHEYLAQLRAQTIPTGVLMLLGGMVDVYDRTIYGRKPIDEPAWNRFEGQIKEAALLLNLNEKDARLRAKPRDA
jgi:hypothetical protein